MFCNNCGNQMKDDAKFCPACGQVNPKYQQQGGYQQVNQQQGGYQQVNQQQGGYQQMNQQYPGGYQQPATTPGKKSGGKKTGLIIALIVALVALIAVVIICAILFKGKKSTSSSSLDGSSVGRYESSGFASAEDAVTAYAVALADKDYNAMISTFAVESYVDHFDLGANVSRLKMYNANAFVMNITNDNDFSREILIQRRVGDITRMIENQYLEIIGVSDQIDVYMPTQIDESGEAFIDNLFSQANAFDSISVEFGEFIDPLQISDNYYSDRTREIMVEQTSVYGADDVDNVCMKVTIDGKEYDLFAQCISYDGNWYIDNLGGTLGTLSGADIITLGGLVPASQLGY